MFLCAVPDVQKDCTIVSGVTYLGHVPIEDPKSKPDILERMAILNTGQSKDIKVSLSVPSHSDGYIQ